MNKDNLVILLEDCKDIPKGSLGRVKTTFEHDLSRVEVQFCINRTLRLRLISTALLEVRSQIAMFDLGKFKFVKWQTKSKDSERRNQ